MSLDFVLRVATLEGYKEGNDIDRWVFLNEILDARLKLDPRQGKQLGIAAVQEGEDRGLRRRAAAAPHWHSPEALHLSLPSPYSKRSVQNQAHPAAAGFGSKRQARHVSLYTERKGNLTARNRDSEALTWV